MTLLELSSDLDTAERDLRALLRGRSLVYEIGVEPDDASALILLLGTALAELRSSYQRVAATYPAILVCAVVADSVGSYDAGALWDRLNVPSASPSEIGRAFEEAIVSLKLARLQVFDELRATRYVSRIVAHGGVPLKCVDALTRLVGFLRQIGADDVDAALALLRGNGLAHLQLERPVRRFLRDTGAVGKDFLERVLFLPEEIRSPDSDAHVAQRVGLPRHVITEFRRAGPKLLAARPHNSGIARPRLIFDPDIMEGPELVLTGSMSVTASWRVRHVGSDQGALKQDVALSRREMRVVIQPARTWTIDAIAKDGRHLRSFEIAGPDERTGILVFDVLSGAQLRDARACLAPEIWLLAPFELQAEDLSVSVEASFSLEHGPWQGWIAHALILSGASGVLRGRLGDEVISIPVGRSASTALTISNAVPSAYGPGGIQVLDGAPVFADVSWTSLDADRWQLGVSVNGAETQYHPAPLDTIATNRLLATLLPDSYERVVLRAIGPMGASSVLEFAIVRGLRTSAGEHTLIPGESLQVLVSASCLGDARSIQGTITFEQPSATVRLPIAHGMDFPLELRGRAIRWRLLDVGDPVTYFSAEPIDLLLLGRASPDRLQLLEVDPVMDVKVTINDEPVRLMRSIRGRSATRVAHVAISTHLKRLRSGSVTELKIDGRVGSHVFPIALLREPIELSLKEPALLLAETPSLAMDVISSKPLDGITVRISSLDRPWRDPIDTAMPATGGRLLLPTQSFASGRHRAVVGIRRTTGEFAQSTSANASQPFLIPLDVALRITPEEDPREGVLLLADDVEIEIPPDQRSSVAPTAVMILGRANVPARVTERLLEALPLNEDDWNEALERASTECEVTPRARVAAAVRLAGRRARSLTKLLDLRRIPPDLLPELLPKLREHYRDEESEVDSRTARLLWLFSRRDFGMLFWEQCADVCGSQLPIAGGLIAVLGGRIGNPSRLGQIKGDLRRLLGQDMRALSPNNRFVGLVMLHLMVHSGKERESLQRLDEVGRGLLQADRGGMPTMLKQECTRAEHEIRRRAHELQPPDQLADRLRLATFVAAGLACSEIPARLDAVDYLADVATLLPHLVEVRVAYAAATCMHSSRDPKFLFSEHV